MPLIILNDPAGITGRRTLQWDFSRSMQQNIEMHLSGGADAELRINGRTVDPLTDPRLDEPPSAGDRAVIVLRPSGGDVLNSLSFGLLGGPVVNSLLPKLPGQEPAGKDSPNNRLTAQANVARAYQARPDVYGYRRVWPDLIQPSTVEYVSQVKYVTEWLCISRGKGTISSVQYAETPIVDIDGSSYELFEPVAGADGYPENGTTTLNDVYETFASDEVNGQEIPYAVAFSSLTKSGTFNAANGATTFTITLTDGPDLDQLKSLAPTGTSRVRFTYTGPTSFDQTCTLQSYVVSSPNVTFTFTSTAWASAQSGSSSFTFDPNGNAYTTIGPYTLPIAGTRLWWNTVFLRGLRGTVVIRAEWWQIDSDGVEVVGTRQTQDFTFTASTYDQMFYTSKVTPSGGSGRYRIQFQRRSVQVDGNGADVAKLEELYAVRYFSTKVLPGDTVMRVTTKATLSATGFSERKFNLRWLRHVRTLSDTTLSASRNFARALAHVWSLAGNPISGINTTALQEINDQHGENSALLRFDGSLDDADMSLGERMTYIADAARCVIWRDGVQWTFRRDQAVPYHEMQLDYRNLSAKGESAIGYGAHLPASNDGIELEYVDETTQAKKAYRRYNISSGAPVEGACRNPKKIRMLACATLAQADNRALLEAWRLIYQRESVNDTSLSDGQTLGLLSVVRWVDPNDFGGEDLQAGEVIAIDADLITTSEPLNWSGLISGRIAFTGEDGRRLGPAVECFRHTDGRVRLSSVPGGLYVADAARQCGSRYSFAVGITEDEMEGAGLYSVTHVRPAADGTVSLAFSNYDARIYQGDE
jgi:hypothetical protein